MGKSQLMENSQGMGKLRGIEKSMGMEKIREMKKSHGMEKSRGMEKLLGMVTRKAIRNAEIKSVSLLYMYSFLQICDYLLSVGSALLTLSITIERFVAITNPFCFNMKHVKRFV